MGSARDVTPDRILRRLEWHVIRPLDGRLQGSYRTPLRGLGTDLRDVREYEFGDDVRHVDWNVTARTDQLFVREYTEDRDVTAWLLLDHSASMGFGPSSRTKATVLCEVTATLAQLLVRGGNRVGAMIYDNDTLARVPPRQGRDQVLVLVSRLLRPLGGRGSVTDLRVLLDGAAPVMRRRSLVVVVSDFISVPGWERSLLRLAERHEVVAIRVADRREVDLPDAGLLVVEDAETGEQIIVDSSDPVLRSRLRQAGSARDGAVVDAARRARVDLHTVTTDDDLLTAFVRIIQSRKRRWNR